MIKKLIFIFVPGLILSMPFFLYAAYRGWVQKFDSFEGNLMGISAFVSVSICLGISAKRIESKKITDDIWHSVHSVRLNLFCYFLFGLMFMILEPLQRIGHMGLPPWPGFSLEMLGANLLSLGLVLLLVVGMAVLYFFLPAVILVMWWVVPLHLKWMRRYRATLDKNSVHT